MERILNTTPLLQEISSDNEELDIEDHSVVLRDEKPLFKPIEPKDKYYTAYLIFYLLGIVTLLPWNFYITANDYWMYKFRDVSKHNSSFGYMVSDKTPMQAEFTSYISVASAIPNLIFLVLNTAISHRISIHIRILGSLVCMFLLMILTLVFVLVDTDGWQYIFFILTLSTIVLLNVCSAILSGSVFGVIGKFSPVYITAAIGGQALGGIFAALAEIVSLSIGASSTHSALVYFIIGNLTILISIVLYVVLIKTLFYKYHTEDQFLESSRDEYATMSFDTVSYKLIGKKIWLYGASMFLCFAITLSVYPGVTVLIESQGKGSGNKWNDVFFVPTIAYLLFSIGDYCGRLIAGKIQKPSNGVILLILSMGRFVFIPLMILCNAQPRYYWTVIFDKDYQYIIILAVCALTNGFLANITAICAPKVVEPNEKELASTLMTVFLGLGLAVGSGISLIMVKLL